MTQHYYLRYIQTDKALLIRLLAVEILNHYYTGSPINSSTRWKKKGNFTRKFKFKDKNEINSSKPIGFSILKQELEQFNLFSSQKFELFPLESVWLDHSLTISKSISIKGDPFIELGTEHVYGTKTPVKLRLDRNGIAATSFMNHLFRHVIQQRSHLIVNSDQILDLSWHLQFRNLICDAVSLVDMTLNRLHYEAENNPKPEWTVSPNLGDRHGVRLSDKLKWINKCTGFTLPNISEEKKSLERLKNLRNHLMHFDPPYFLLEFEELTHYLNDILKLGCLIYKIRKTVNIPISENLIEFMLQDQVQFIPKTEVKIVMTM